MEVYTVDQPPRRPFRWLYVDGHRYFVFTNLDKVKSVEESGLAWVDLWVWDRWRPRRLPAPRDYVRLQNWELRCITERGHYHFALSQKYDGEGMPEVGNKWLRL